MKIASNHGQCVSYIALEKGRVVWSVQNEKQETVELCDSVILFGSEEDAQAACEDSESPKWLNLLEPIDVGVLS